MEHGFTNELINESSLYLLQHAHNPVQWYAWGDKALQLAKSTDKPILVSIGYSACHWCHVMERESFENTEVAQFMNEHFINIKIDREERPDLDHIYMDAVQILSGSGGWPLNVFLTPDGRPFYGGTYFPPAKAFNRPSWIDILNFIKDIWADKRTEVETQASKLLQHIDAVSSSLNNQIESTSYSSNNSEYSQEFCEEIKNKILKTADLMQGGFGTAPKFPQTFSIQYLISYSHFCKDEKALNHALFSLKTMLRGGIYDQIAGGLSRYSTDEKWLAPHFEKMLYDNALLINVICDAFQISKDLEFKHAIEKTISFCLNEMYNNNGGFYAAIDADSEGEEGKFYVWEKSELEMILGKDAEIFCEYYGVKESGNWEGKNILHVSNEDDFFANSINISVDDLKAKLADSEKKLLAERNKRIRPATDDKILLGWNALMLTALCKASAALKNEKYKRIALSLYDFIKKEFSRDGQVTFHTYKNGIVRYNAYLDDYAYLIQACIHLQELTGDEKYLDEAKLLTQYVIDNFKQSDGSLFYYTNINQSDIVIRKVEIYDNAIPSGNSVMSENLFYLSVILDKEEWKNHSIDMIRRVRPLIEKHPNSFAVWANSILKQQTGILEIVVTGQKCEALSQEILMIFMPNKVFQKSNVEKEYPLLKNKKYEKDGLIYVCRNFSCLKPVNNIIDFKKLVKN